MTCAGVGTPRYRHGCERRVSFPRRAKSTYDSRRKLPLIETSKTSVDPTPPITLAYAYRIILALGYVASIYAHFLINAGKF